MDGGVNYLGDNEKYEMANAVATSMRVLHEIVADDDYSTEDRVYAAAVILENTPQYLYEEV